MTNSDIEMTNANSDDYNLKNLPQAWGVPSVFFPDAFRDSLCEITPTMVGMGISEEDIDRFRLLPDLEYGSVSDANESDFEELADDSTLFFTGISGYGFGNYHYRWFLFTKKLAVSIVLPVASPLSDEDIQKKRNDAIDNANNLASLIYGAYIQMDSLSDKYPNATFQFLLDEEKATFRFVEDGVVLEESDSPHELIELLHLWYPTRLSTTLNRIFV